VIAGTGFAVTKKILRPDGVEEIATHHLCRNALPVGSEKYRTAAIKPTKTDDRKVKKATGIQMKAVKNPTVSQIGAVKNATTRVVKKIGIEAKAMKATMTGGM